MILHVQEKASLGLGFTVRTMDYMFNTESKKVYNAHGNFIGFGEMIDGFIKVYKVEKPIEFRCQ